MLPMLFGTRIYIYTHTITPTHIKRRVIYCVLVLFFLLLFLYRSLVVNMQSIRYTLAIGKVFHRIYFNAYLY